MSKFVKTETELDTDLDKWLYVLKNMSNMDKIPVYLRKPVFEKLFNIAEYSNLTKEEKTMYDTSLKRKWDTKVVLDYAINEAVKEVELKKNFSFVKGLIEGTHFSDEKIAGLASVPLEFVQKVRAELQGN